MTLEYGPNYDTFDPFSVTRIQREDVEQTHNSNFLHPVGRCFERGNLMAEHHIIENLEAEWAETAFPLEDEHIKPLQTFFQQQLGTIDQPEVVYA